MADDIIDKFLAGKGYKAPNTKPAAGTGGDKDLDDLLNGEHGDKVRKFFGAIKWAEGGQPDLIVGGQKRFDVNGDHPNIVGLTTPEGPSTAAGDFQITGSNWYGDKKRGVRGLKERLGATKFDPESQLRAALLLFKDRDGGKGIEALKNDDYDTALEIARKDWAALPGSTLHKGRYPGRKYDDFMRRARGLVGDGEGQKTGKAQPAYGSFNDLAAEILGGGKGKPGQTPAQGRMAIGDSIAAGLIWHGGINGAANKGVQRDFSRGATASVGSTPKEILENIKAMRDDSLRGQDIVLSTGASNDPRSLDAIQAQIDTLRQKGVSNITILGVGPHAKLAGVNERLAKIAKDNGVNFTGPLKTGKDQIHPNQWGKLARSLPTGKPGPTFQTDQPVSTRNDAKILEQPDIDVDPSFVPRQVGQGESYYDFETTGRVGKDYAYTGTQNGVHTIKNRDGDMFTLDETTKKWNPVGPTKRDFDADKNEYTLAADQDGLQPGEVRRVRDGVNYVFQADRKIRNESAGEAVALLEAGTKPVTEFPADGRLKKFYEKERKARKLKDTEELRQKFIKAEPKLASGEIQTPFTPAEDAIFETVRANGDAGWGQAKGEVERKIDAAPQSIDQPDRGKFGTVSVDVNPYAEPGGDQNETVFRQAARQMGKTIYGRELTPIEVDALTNYQQQTRGGFVFGRENNKPQDAVEGRYHIDADSVGEYKAYLDQNQEKFAAERVERLKNFLAQGGELDDEAVQGFTKLGFDPNQLGQTINDPAFSSQVDSLKAEFQSALQNFASSPDPDIKRNAISYARWSMGWISSRDLNTEIDEYNDLKAQKRAEIEQLSQGGGDALAGQTGRGFAMAGGAYIPRTDQQKDEQVQAYLTQQIARYGTASNIKKAKEQEALLETARQNRIAAMSWPEYIGRTIKDGTLGIAKSAVSIALSSSLRGLSLATVPIINALGVGGGGMKVTDHPLYSGAQRIDEFLDYMLPTNKDMQQEFLAGKLPQGIGSTLGMIPGGLLKVAPRLGIAALSSLQMGGDTYKEMIEDGATEEQAQLGAMLSAPLGITEIVGIGGALARLNKGTSAGLWKRLWSEAWRAGANEIPEEVTQEGFQTISGNLIKKLTYDPDRTWDKGVFDAMLVAGISAPIASAGITALNFAKNRMAIKKIIQQEEANGVIVQHYGENEIYAFGKKINVTPEVEPLVERHGFMRDQITGLQQQIADIEKSVRGASIDDKRQVIPEIWNLKAHINALRGLQAENAKNIVEAAGIEMPEGAVGDAFIPDAIDEPKIGPSIESITDIESIKSPDLSNATPIGEDMVDIGQGLGFDEPLTDEAQATDIGGEEQQTGDYAATDAPDGQTADTSSGKKTKPVAPQNQGKGTKVAATSAPASETGQVSNRPVSSPLLPQALLLEQQDKPAVTGEPKKDKPKLSQEETDKIIKGATDRGLTPEQGQQIADGYVGTIGLPKTEKPAKYSNVQIPLAKEQAEPITKFRTGIDEADLADKADLPSYAKSAIDITPHVTVKYGLKTNDAADISNLFEGEKPITVTLGKTSVFPGAEKGNYDVLIAEIDSPELLGLNKKVSDKADVDEAAHPEYTPHVTIAYLKKGAGAKYAGRNDFEGQSFTYDGVTFSPANKSGKVNLPFSKPQAQYERLPDSLDIPRSEMPQIGRRNMDAFVAFAKERGTDITDETVKASDLKPSQNEYNPAQAAQLPDEALKKPLLVSSDNRILDGHNTLMRLQKDSPDAEIKIRRIDLPALEAIGLMRAFPSATYKPVGHVGTSDQLAPKHPDEEIVNPIDRQASQEEKARQLMELTAENKPIVEAILAKFREMGLTHAEGLNKNNEKDFNAIIDKANRPSVKAKKKWFDVEHIRDAFRFRAGFQNFEDIPKMFQILKDAGVEFVKVDTEKFLDPGAWGWRPVAFDLVMPNGQLVEFYTSFSEMIDAQYSTGPGHPRGNHDLFEDWRNKPEELPADEDAERNKAIAESKRWYDLAYQAGLDRLGLDATAARASFIKAARSLGSLTSDQSLDLKSGVPSDQTPSGDRTISGMPAQGSPSNIQAEPSDIVPINNPSDIEAPSNESVTQNDEVEPKTLSAAEKKRIAEIDKELLGLSGAFTAMSDAGFGAGEVMAEMKKLREEKEQIQGYRTVGSDPTKLPLEPKDDKPDTPAIDLNAMFNNSINTLIDEQMQDDEDDGGDPFNFDEVSLKQALEAPKPEFKQHVYDRITPQFKQGLGLLADIPDVQDKMTAFIRRLNESSSIETVRQLQPYVVKFFEEFVLNPAANESIKEEGTQDGDSANNSDLGTDVQSDNGLGGEKEDRAGDENPAGDLAGGQSDQAGSDGQGGQSDAGTTQTSDKPGSSTGSESGSDESASTDVRDTSDGGSAAANPVRNFRITNELDFSSFSPVQRFDANIAALEILKVLDEEKRPATPAEQTALAKYVGWGGLQQAFKEEGDWAARNKQLRDLLTQDEYENARRSTQDAHFTSKTVVDGIWKAALQFGFKGGNVLEPSMGSGNFFGLRPAGMHMALTGVEFDPLTARIAKALYPNADIYQRGFQDFYLAPESQDLVVGNPPFGAQSLFDPTDKELSKFKIHAYFIAKSINSLRPGGVLAVVVSKGFMDASDAQAREARKYVADRAELIGAIRLPNTAFKGNANTEVTTDLVFFQKKGGTALVPDEITGEPVRVSADNDWTGGLNWLDTTEITDAETGEPIRINNYFEQHPEMMLGDMTLAGSMYGPNQPALIERSGADLEADIAEALDSLPSDIITDQYAAQVERLTAAEAKSLEEYPNMIPYNYGINAKGEIYQLHVDMNQRATERPIESTGKTADRMRAMIAIRDLVTGYLAEQGLEATTDERLEVLRADLNSHYDAFVKKFGFLSQDANKRAFREDPQYPLLQALETKFDKGVSAGVAKSSGIPERAPSAQKSDLLLRRTNFPVKQTTFVDNAQDGLMMSLVNTGGVDLDYIRDLYKDKTAEDIINELGDQIFRDPVAQQWVIKDAYLSGDVKTKLAEAEKAAADDKSFGRNIEALQAVQPKDRTADEVFVKLGTNWIPFEIYQEFYTHLTQGKLTGAYSPALGRFTGLKASGGNEALLQNRWGTKRAPASKIMAAVLSNQDPVVRDPVWEPGARDPKYVVNQEETAAAVGKAEEMRDEFLQWLWKDTERRKTLLAQYNDQFNRTVKRHYDGSHLIDAETGIARLPGLSRILNLRPHILNGVFRIIQNGKALIDHCVGAGKTPLAITAGMEMRRLGLAKKPAYVVPNHLVDQWAQEFKKFYPGAKVLAASKKDFQKGKRAELFAKIATGDWDAVIIAHSSFKFIEVPRDVEMAFMREQMEEIIQAIKEQEAAEMASGSRRKSRSLKDLEKMRDKIKAKLAYLSSAPKDALIDFHGMGIDALFVDEAHNYKNLYFTTQKQGVQGLGDTKGSQRAFDMFMKTQMILKRNDDRNVIFLTGTPVSNSLSEIFHMQRYLMNDVLKANGIGQFDAWANAFAHDVKDWQLDAAGRFTQRTRFSKFGNLPELRQLWESVTDSVSRDDLIKSAIERKERFPVPQVRTHKVIAERSPEQAEYIGIGVPRVDGEGYPAIDTKTGQQVVDYPKHSIIYRLDNWKEIQKGDPKENVLRITTHARQAGLDMRLIDPNAPDFAGSKLNKAAENIFKIYQENDHRAGTQLAFLDLATPKTKSNAAPIELEPVAPPREEDDDERDLIDEEEGINPDEMYSSKSDFDAYAELRRKLISKGIPAEQIAYIHDATTDEQKGALFARVNRGEIRVLLGSTLKMGEGMNVQKRLVALHNLDSPWKPAHLEQRNGRIIRQGNEFYEADPENFTVDIFNYATDRTYDARMWEVIEQKGTSIDRFRFAPDDVREIEDISPESADAAEMKAAATGDPRILQSVQMLAEIRKLETQATNHKRGLYDMQERIGAFDREETPLHRSLERYKEAEKIAKANPKTDDTVLRIADKEWTLVDLKPTEGLKDKEKEKDDAQVKAARVAVEKEIIDRFQRARLLGGFDGVYLGKYRGFKLEVANDGYTSMAVVLVHPDTDKPIIKSVIDGARDKDSGDGKISFSGIMTRLNNMVDGFTEDVERTERALAKQKEEIDEARKLADKPFIGQAELDEKKAASHALLKELRSGGDVEFVADEGNQSVAEFGQYYQQHPKVEFSKTKFVREEDGDPVYLYRLYNAEGGSRLVSGSADLLEPDEAAAAFIRKSESGVLINQDYGAEIDLDESDEYGLKSVMASTAPNQTETPAFKKWFGDSKVVDENGGPLRVYSGRTREDSDVLRPGAANAIYFTDDPAGTDGFTGGEWHIENGYKPHIIPAYLSAPKLWDFENIEDSLAASKYFSTHPEPDMDEYGDWSSGGMWAIESDKFQQFLKQGGYDGFTALETDGKGKTYAVYSSNQVKSAIGNNGNFDANDDSILNRKLDPEEMSDEDKMTADRMRELADAPLETVLDETDFEQNGDRIFLSPASHELYRRTLEQIAYEDGKLKLDEPAHAEDLFNGQFIPPGMVNKMISVLRAKAQEAQAKGYGTKFRDTLTRHADALQNAKKPNGTVILYVFPSAIPEELFHQADFLGAVEKSILKRHSAAAIKILDAHRIRQVLYEKHFAKFNTYRNVKNKALLNAILRAEIPPFLLELSESQLSDLGITPEERADYLLTWFEGYAEKNGVESLNNFDGDQINVQDFISRVKKAQTTNKDGQAGGQNGSDSRQGEQGTETPSDDESDRRNNASGYDRDAAEFFGLGPGQKWASLPATLRRAGIDIDDFAYDVFGDRAATEEARKLINENGIEGTLRILDSVGQLDVHHALASFMIQRMLMNRAAELDATDPQEAENLRAYGRQVGAKHVLNSIAAGRFTRAASIIPHTVEGVVFAFQQLIADRTTGERTVSPEQWQKIEEMGRELEEKAAALEAAVAESSRQKRKIKSLEDELEGKSKKKRRDGGSLKSRKQLVAKVKEEKQSNVDKVRAKLREKYSAATQSTADVEPRLEASDTALKSALETDPDFPIDDFAEVGAMMLTEGIDGDVAYLPEDFKAEMQGEFGDAILPYFDQIYKAAWEKRDEWLRELRKDEKADAIRNKYGEDLEDWEVDEIIGEQKERAARRRAIENVHKLSSLGKAPKTDMDAMRRIIANIAPSAGVAAIASVMSEGGTASDIHKAFEDLGVKEDKKRREMMREAADVVEKAKAERKKERAAISNELLKAQNDLTDIDNLRFKAREEVRKSQRKIADELKRVRTGELSYRWSQVLDASTVFRTMMASFDLSAGFRQGGFFGFAKPEEQAAAFAAMFKSFSQEAYGQQIMKLENHPMFSLMQRAGIDFAMAGRSESKYDLVGEELFRGEEMIEKVPLLGKLLAEGVVKPSERTYTAFLDTQRVIMADIFFRDLMSRGLTYADNPAEFRKIADFVNIATGRGTIPKGNFGKVIMNLPLFAPRYTLSRLQLINMTLNPVAYYNMPPQARKIVAKQAGRFYGTTMGILGVVSTFGYLIGASVNWDDDDSDFLKIKVGNAHYDILSGLAPTAKLLIKLVHSAYRTKLGTDNRVSGEFGWDIANAVGRFARGKLSPLASLAVDYALDEDYVGNKTELLDWDGYKGYGAGLPLPGKAIYSRLMPLTISDMIEAGNIDGPWGIVKSTPFAIFGFGVSTYKPRPEQAETEAEKLAAKMSSWNFKGKGKEKDARDLKADLVARSRKGEDVSAEIAAGREKGLLDDYAERDIRSAAGKTLLVDKSEGLSLEYMYELMRVAKGKERDELLPLINEKMKNADVDGKLEPAMRKKLEALGGRVLGDFPMPDAVKAEFTKLRLKTPDVGEDLTLEKGAKSTKLSTEQYDRYRRETLEKIYERVQEVIADPDYRDADADEKKRLIKKAINKGRAAEQKETKSELRGQ